MTRSSGDKLNSVHILGAIGIAAAIAGVAGSWPLFLLVALSLIVVSVITGEFRTPRR